MKPSPPLNVVVHADGIDSYDVWVTWEPSPDSGGQPIQSYDVLAYLRQPDGTYSLQASWIYGPNVIQSDFLAAQPGQSWLFLVRANNGYAVGEASRAIVA